MGRYVDDHRFYLIRSGGTQDITDWVSAPALADDLDALSVELSFTAMRNNLTDKSMPWPGMEAGDKLRVVNSGSGQECFSGVILSVGQDGSVTANDPGWYLSKSEIILQLDKASAPDAVQRMCAKAGIAVGTIDLPPTTISDQWFGATPETILQDILEICSAETGKRYKRRVKNGALNVTPLPTTPITVYHRSAASVQPFDISLAKGAISGSDSMQELINSYVLTEDSSSAKILGTLQDDASIAKYGLIQKVERLSGDENSAQAMQRLKNQLAQSNRTARDRTVDEIWGADEVESGSIVQFVVNRYDVSGPIRVKSVTKKFGHEYMMALTLEV